MRTRIKAVLAAPVVAGLVGGLGLATVLKAVPPAHADSTFAHYGYEGDYNAWAYRDELRYVGLLHEDIYNARSLSARLCGERAEGYTEYQVGVHLDQSPDGYTIAQEVAMVAGAEWHFCPEYYAPAR